MKISNLTEMATPSSMPDPNTAAPKFGRSDDVLESGVGTTTSGAVATDSKPMGKMRTRGQGSMFKGISTSSKYANSRKAGISEDIITEGAIKQLMMDLKQMPESEFKTTYGMSKLEARTELKKPKQSNVNEDELSEEQLRAKQKRDEIFKKAKDRELGNKPQSREIMAKEEFNGEYDDEAGMADNNLETMRRAVDGIDNVISAGDNLPEWCQEKIAVAKSMLVTVWDYMRSEEEIHEGYYSSYDNNRTGFRKPQRDLSGEGEPEGMFTVVINGRPWKEFTSNKAFSVAKTIATKHPDKTVQVKWPTGQLNTVKEGITEGWKDEADDYSEWSNHVKQKLSQASPSQRLGLAKQLSQVEVKNFGTTIQGGFNKETGKPQAGLGLTDTVRSILRSIDMPQSSGQNSAPGNFSMPFGSVDIQGMENATPEELAVMKKAVMMGPEVAGAAGRFYRKNGTITEQDLVRIQQKVAADASDEWKQQRGVTENANAYGYEVGQTVKLDNGKQGRVIDIFDDSIEVLLTTGRTITIAFQDAHVLDEQGSGPEYIDNMMNQYKASLPGQTPVAPAKPARAVDAKGRTQSQWLALVKKKFPAAKVMVAKMMDGPCHAILPDGRKLSWIKVKQPGAKPTQQSRWQVAEGYNPNSVSAQHRRDIQSHHEAEIRRKAESGDPDAVKRLALMNKHKERRANDFDARMERESVGEGQLGNILPWPEVANKISSAMKAMGWKAQRKGDDAFMFSTKGQEDESQWYMVMIDNEGNGMFTYALGTFEGDRPDIGEQGTLPTTEASVSEVLMAIRDGYGLNEQGVTESSQRVDSLVTDALRIMKGSEVSDAVSALKTVLGDREYNGRRGHYNFYVKQILDMYNSQGVAEESKGLWANIHAKRERIKQGSGEKMRKPGSTGAPTASALRKSAK